MIKGELFNCQRFRRRKTRLGELLRDNFIFNLNGMLNRVIHELINLILIGILNLV